VSRAYQNRERISAPTWWGHEPPRRWRAALKRVLARVPRVRAGVAAAPHDAVPIRGACGGTSDVTVHPSDNRLVPLTVFDCKGIPATRREGIEAAVIAGGKHVAGPHEAWIAADPARGDVRVIITGPLGFRGPC
jgi:hypothetical protein